MTCYGRKCEYNWQDENVRCGIHDLQKILGNGELAPIPDLPGRIPEQFSQLTIVEHYSDIQKISLNFREVLKVAV